jgi:hypothetical protein
MKNVFGKKKVAVMVIFASIVLLSIPIGIFSCNNVHDADDADDEYAAGIPLGGAFEDLRITETTREIPLELVCQFELGDELTNLKINNQYFEQLYTDGFYLDARTTWFQEKFSIELETEHEHVLMSHGRAIGQLVYDTNWELAYYLKTSDGGTWGDIAIPKYERGYSPNIIYVYVSDFPLYCLYTGDHHGYFKNDIRYMDDEPKWDVQMWSKDNPSPRIAPLLPFDYSVPRQPSGY